MCGLEKRPLIYNVTSTQKAACLLVEPARKLRPMFRKSPRETACPPVKECLSRCLLTGQLLVGEQVVKRW